MTDLNVIVHVILDTPVQLTRVHVLVVEQLQDLRSEYKIKL